MKIFTRGYTGVSSCADSVAVSAPKRSSYNIGWMLLRPLICFEVILEHFWAKGDSIPAWQVPLDYMLSLSVPVFMFMAFYLGERHITTDEPEYIRRRVWRVAWPLVGWGLIYFAVLVPFRWLRGHEVPGVDDLLWQMTTGHSELLNPSMWYQSVLLILTLAFFYTFRKPVRQNALVILTLLCGAFVMEYAGLNEYLFGDMRYELKYPLGRVAEMVPFAVMGYACARYGLLERLPAGRVLAVALPVIVSVMAMIYLYDEKNLGFGYSNIFYVPAALGLVVAVWYIPFPHVGESVLRVLRFLSSFTLGIYCMHRLVMAFVQPAGRMIFPGLGAFGLCVITDIVSFIASWLISKLPWKWAADLVR